MSASPFSISNFILEYFENTNSSICHYYNTTRGVTRSPWLVQVGRKDTDWIPRSTCNLLDSSVNFQKFEFCRQSSVLFIWTFIISCWRQYGPIVRRRGWTSIKATVCVQNVFQHRPSTRFWMFGCPQVYVARTKAWVWKPSQNSLERYRPCRRSLRNYWYVSLFIDSLI